MGIEIKNVGKSFGTTRSLDGVSVTFDGNRIYGLLGNNGAGKTTLFGIIANRLYPDSGDVLIDGEPVYDNDNALRKIILVGEQNLYPEDMRVDKAFIVAAMFYPNFDREYATKLAALFELDTKKKIKALSTGYASIFRLIVALSANTPYMLLDEPVLGLDACHRDLFYKLLIEIYAENPRTIVIATHLIQEISGLIEHAVIIRDGEIIRDAARDDLLSGCYTVSGPASLVESYVIGRDVLSVQSLGGLKTACVQGDGEPLELPSGLEVGAVNLQDYFIDLMTGAGAAK